MNLIEQLFPRVRAELLRLLFVDGERALHLRELARLSGLAVGTIQREVVHMRQAGLILEQRDGNRLYFRANRENPIFPELRGIALKTTGLHSQLVQALVGVGGIRLAFVYGSFAAGTAAPGSDIDLMIIGSAGLRNVVPHLRNAAESMNREINPHVISESSFLRKLESKDVYINNVTKNKKLWIVGSEDEFAKLASKRVDSPT